MSEHMLKLAQQFRRAGQGHAHGGNANMARPAKLTEKDKSLIRTLRSQGLPYKAIAVRFDVSQKTIIRICNPEYNERQKASNRKYQAEKGEQIRAKRAESSQRFELSFHTTHDSDVVEHLSKQENVQDYIRQLVLQDIKSEEAHNGSDE